MKISTERREIARETMRRNATKHGLASGETKTTYYLCKSLIAHQPPYFYGDDSEPDIAPEWFDLLSFVRDVVREIGPRPCRHYKLTARPDLRHLLEGGEPRPTILQPRHLEWYLPPSNRWPKNLPPHPMSPRKLCVDGWEWWEEQDPPPACPVVML